MTRDARITEALESLFLAAHEPILPAQMAHYREQLSACTADQVWDACLAWIRADKGRTARTDELLDLIFGEGPRPAPGWNPPCTREEKLELIRRDPKIRAYLADVTPALVAEAMEGVARG